MLIFDSFFCLKTWVSFNVLVYDFVLFFMFLECIAVSLGLYIWFSWSVGNRWRGTTSYKVIWYVFVHSSYSGDGWFHVFVIGFVLQAWSPFNFGSDVDSNEKELSVRSLCKDVVFYFELAFCWFLFNMTFYLFVISVFQQLIQNMNKGGNESEESDLKVVSLVSTNKHYFALLCCR